MASPLQLAIPATLQDSLMARLDRLGAAKEIAQVGATIGREFNYDLLQAVSSLNEEALQQGLKQLVEAELVYQRGLVPQAHYLFKHALIQDTAYQSLLKSTRQQLHQQIAQVLEEQFPDTKENQPELLAHHYTEAGLIEQAIPYWQQAGQRAHQRSANIEAVSHFTKGLTLLKMQPDTPERTQQELTLQIGLGRSLLMTKGPGAVEVGETYARARELCQQVAETPQLFPVLWGLRAFYSLRGEHQTARELGEQVLHLAQSARDPALLLEAHYALGVPLFVLGEFALARKHFEQGVALYDPQQHQSHALLYAQDPGVGCLTHGSRVLWVLGYPDQALKESRDALILAQERAHPYSLAFALSFAALLHQERREEDTARERAEAAIALASEQGFPFLLAVGTLVRGWALVEQGQVQEGIAQMHQNRGPFGLSLLAEAYGKVGQVEEGLTLLAQVLAAVDRVRGREDEAELYRLKGELTLISRQGLKVQGPKVAKAKLKSVFTKPSRLLVSSKQSRWSCGR